MSTARYKSRPVKSQKLARKMPLDRVLWFQVPHIHDSITHFSLAEVDLLFTEVLLDVKRDSASENG
jgi:hypothetical protein